MSPSNVLAIGASRNIGYLTSIRLLDAGATVTFLLRNPAKFDEDSTIQKYASAGKARFIKGDALVEADCKSAWEFASQPGTVDYLMFSVGGTPRFHPTKGLLLDPPNLVTQSFLNAICSMPKTSPEPRIVCVSSIGLTKESHRSLPLLFKPLYSWLLAAPHVDKMGMERVISHITGLPWNTKDDGEPTEEIMGKDWTSRPGLPVPGSFKNILVVRPAFLTDGECNADNPKPGKEPYRASTKELGGYVVSRKDVAHFMSTVVLGDWSEWQGKIVNVGY